MRGPDEGLVGGGGEVLGQGQGGDDRQEQGGGDRRELGGVDRHEQAYGPILPMEQFAAEGDAQPPTPPSNSGGSGVSTRAMGRGPGVSTRGMGRGSGTSTGPAPARLPSLMSLR